MNISINSFYEDVHRHLYTLSTVVDEVQNGTNNKEKISELFRALHTIKGSAGIMGFDNITQLAHKSEDLLDLVRNNKIVFDSNLGTLFIEVVNMLAILTTALKYDLNIDINDEKELKSIEIKLTHYKNKPTINKKEEVIKMVKKKTILVVDDASMIRNLASKTAEAAGYNVVVAEDGLDGLEKLEQNQIDMIFSDINMPQMNGLEMVAKIRAISKYEFLPIVMLTTEKKEELKRQGKALGVKAWLVKPFNKNKLLTVLEKLLG